VKKFESKILILYLSYFLPISFFGEQNQEVISDFQEEEKEILNLSALVSIHRRLEKIEKIQNLNNYQSAFDKRY